MNVAIFSQIVPSGAGYKREFAQLALRVHKVFRDSKAACNLNLPTDGSSKLPVVFCQHRYPSPCRSVPTQNRPAYPHLGGISHLAANRWMWFDLVELAAYFVNLIPRNTKQKGKITCLRKLGLSQQQRPSALRAALNQTANARLWGPGSAASQAKQSATTTALKARLRAVLLARFRGTSLAANATQHLHNSKRRRGASPAAFSV